MAESLSPIDDSIDLLNAVPQAVGRGTPASQRALRAAEREIGFSFPNEYRRFVNEVGPVAITYEGPSRSWFLVYGLTAERAGLPNVIWSYVLDRSATARRFLTCADRTTSAPFGQVRFAMDLSTRWSKTDEPVIAVSRTRPYEVQNETAAGSFGAWLLSTLREVLPMSRDMWARRCAQLEHSTTTEEYGQPGPRVFMSKCTCGWTSHLKPRSEAELDGELHRSNPRAMHEEPCWT